MDCELMDWFEATVEVRQDAVYLPFNLILEAMTQLDLQNCLLEVAGGRMAEK